MKLTITTNEITLFFLMDIWNYSSIIQKFINDLDKIIYFDHQISFHFIRGKREVKIKEILSFMNCG